MEQRRARRFTLELPVAITRSGADRVSEAGLTKNISSTGVLFTSEKQPELGGPIEYVITLSGHAEHAVTLRCIGKVMRSERIADDVHPAFAIAATLERYEFVRS